jgi:hypothetical protein
MKKHLLAAVLALGFSSVAHADIQVVCGVYSGDQRHEHVSLMQKKAIDALNANLKKLGDGYTGSAPDIRNWDNGPIQSVTMVCVTASKP